MSRSIHKTIKKIAKENTKAELSDENNPDLQEYAKKIKYKNDQKQKRQMSKIKNKKRTRTI